MKKIKLNNQPIGPFPAMIVGAMVNEKPTYTTVGAGGCACLAPVLCVSLKNTHYITEGIVQTGSFSVNIPGAALVKETDYCGIASGKNVDKSRLFTPFFDSAGQIPGKDTDVSGNETTLSCNGTPASINGTSAPMIEECPLNFLCKVCDSIEIRGFTMFFGDIVAAFVNEDCTTQGQPDPLKIDPIIMMAFSYCNLDSVIGRPFSEGEKLMS
jgi:flavin reductase (DIM6/NTAB) family NADH-FMN oxidoreductase RutF